MTVIPCFKTRSFSASCNDIVESKHHLMGGHWPMPATVAGCDLQPWWQSNIIVISLHFLLHQSIVTSLYNFYCSFLLYMLVLSCEIRTNVPLLNLIEIPNNPSTVWEIDEKLCIVLNCVIGLVLNLRWLVLVWDDCPWIYGKSDQLWWLGISI